MHIKKCVGRLGPKYDAIQKLTTVPDIMYFLYPFFVVLFMHEQWVSNFAS